MTLTNLSDPQTKEIAALFKFFDTDRDGLISPRSATKLCEQLGFHLEPAHFSGDPGSTPLALPDMLDWCDSFCGQCNRSNDLRLAQRFQLLRACDVFAKGPRVSQDAMLQFLSLGQHAVRPEAVEQMLIEVGTEGELSKRDMAQLLSSTGEMDIGRRKKRNSTTPKA